MEANDHDSAWLGEAMFLSDDQDAYVQGFADALQFVGDDGVQYATLAVPATEATHLMAQTLSTDSDTTLTELSTSGSVVTHPVSLQPTLTDISMSVSPRSPLPPLPYSNGGVLPPIDVLAKPRSSSAANLNGTYLHPYDSSCSYLSSVSQDQGYGSRQSSDMNSDSEDETSSVLSASTTSSTFSASRSTSRSRTAAQSEEKQEEKKKKRNREAAARCRAKKLENISTLTERVQDLKGEHSQLLKTVTSLREDISQLKQQLLQHSVDGCMKLASGAM